MGKSFNSAIAFRMSLEQRLRTLQAESNVSLQALRLKVVIERLLARLFSSPDPPWLLKGGYALELRFSPKARTTKDVDLSAKSTESKMPDRVKWIRTELQLAIRQERGDFFSFRVADSASELQGPADGGIRFLIEAILADKVFAKFHLDVGFNDPVLSEPESLEGQDFLGFAGIAPPRVLAIPRSQQFAEKIHAYTKPWKDRPNTRVKDLVDLVLFITNDSFAAEAVRDAAERTFAYRATHPLPKDLPAPPDFWRSSFEAMANELKLEPSGMNEGWELVRAFWRELWT